MAIKPASCISGRLLGATVAVLLSIAASGAAPAEASLVAEAGSLGARVGTAPWGLSLVDRRGRPVLAEDPSTGEGASGTLGFRSVGVWRRATRVISAHRERRAYVAKLKTTDPAGRTLEVRIRAGREGVIALRGIGPWRRARGRGARDRVQGTPG